MELGIRNLPKILCRAIHHGLKFHLSKKCVECGQTTRLTEGFIGAGEGSTICFIGSLCNVRLVAVILKAERLFVAGTRLMPLPKPADEPEKSRVPGKGRMSTYCLEKLGDLEV